MKRRKVKKDKKKKSKGFLKRLSSFWRKSEVQSCILQNTRSYSPTYQSYRDLISDDDIDLRAKATSSRLPVFETYEEMEQCLKRAQIEVDLENALKDLHENTIECLQGSLPMRPPERPRTPKRQGGRSSFNPPGSVSSFDDSGSFKPDTSCSPTRESISICGVSSTSGDSAISTAHSSSEISKTSCQKSSPEFQLSLFFLQTMATLEETRKSLERDEKQEKKSLSESLNLSDYSPGTSNFDSDSEEDFEFPGPPLHIDVTPPGTPTPGSRKSSGTFSNFDRHSSGNDSRTATLQSNSTVMSSNLSSIFSGGTCIETPGILKSSYRGSEFHYNNLGSSFNNSKADLLTCKDSDDVFNDNQLVGKFSGDSPIRRCLSTPEFAQQLLSSKCENCHVLKEALQGLLKDCSEMNGLLRILLDILTCQDSTTSKSIRGVGDRLSSIDHVIKKKQRDIDTIIEVVEQSL